MIVKGIFDENFNHYKKPSMVIAFPKCNFKCDKECGKQVCQNSTLANSPNLDVSIDTIVSRYLSNFLTSAIVCSGLEAFDSFDDLHELIKTIRNYTQEDIVIYTGYNKEEILDKVNILKQYTNIIIKFGRFIPDQEKHYDDVLGVELASPNQYAERIS